MMPHRPAWIGTYRPHAPRCGKIGS